MEAHGLIPVLAVLFLVVAPRVPDDFNDPVLSEAVEAAEDAGYLTGPSDCDFGAAEALANRRATSP